MDELLDTIAALVAWADSLGGWEAASWRRAEGLLVKHGRRSPDMNDDGDDGDDEDAYRPLPEDFPTDPCIDLQIVARAEVIDDFRIQAVISHAEELHAAGPRANG